MQGGKEVTRKTFLILLALVLALSVGLVACEPAEEEEEEEEEEEPSLCVDFEDLTLATQYHVGDTIYTSGAIITVEQFQGHGNYAEVGNTGEAGGSGQEMGWINNVNLRFDFNGSCDGLSLLFGEYGGSLHIDINDDPRDFEDFHDIDGDIIGGVNVSVVNGFGQDKGSLTLSGTINQNSFAIGGQELVIDHVCLTSPFEHVYALTIPSPPLTMVPPCRVTDPGDGTFIYAEGTVVDLVAEVVAEGYNFVEWTGDVGTIADVNAAETTITMEGNYEIAARCEQTAMPDLVPAKAPGSASQYASVDAYGRWVFYVRNQGTVDAPASTTGVKVLATGHQYRLMTPVIPAGATVETQQLQPDCGPGAGDCHLEITADYDRQVDEASETNNTVTWTLPP
jgi:hypothetical protein